MHRVKDLHHELTRLSHWVQLKNVSYSEATDIICMLYHRR
jgi:hypothetical protein